MWNISELIDFPRALRRIREYELVVVLHSAAGDNLEPVRRASAGLQRRRGPLFVFFGNEYDRMPEKIGFARDVGAEFIASLLPIDPPRSPYPDSLSPSILPPPAPFAPLL